MRVVSTAWPAAESGAVPSDTAPLRNITLPVGVPAPGAFTATVAVRTTGSPATWWG